MNQYANDFNSTVRAYYDDLKRCKPLSKLKEKRLIKLCRRGNIKAQNQLLEANLKFVFDIAKHYTGRGLSISELISEGNMGLIKAIDKFDEEKDIKFISYAVWWIKQAMMESIKKRKAIKFVDIEPNEDNDSAIDNKMCEMDGNASDFLATPFSTECDEKLKEVQEHQKSVVAKIISTLNERERKIIECYFGINDEDELSLVEIGEKLNLTSERVRQIKQDSLRKLRSQAMMCNDFEDLFV